MSWRYLLKESIDFHCPGAIYSRKSSVFIVLELLNYLRKSSIFIVLEAAYLGSGPVALRVVATQGKGVVFFGAGGLGGPQIWSPPPLYRYGGGVLNTMITLPHYPRLGIPAKNKDTHTHILL